MSSKTTHDTSIRCTKEEVKLNILETKTEHGRKLIKVGCSACSYTDWICSEHKSKYQIRARGYHSTGRASGKQHTSAPNDAAFTAAMEQSITEVNSSDSRSLSSDCHFVGASVGKSSVSLNSRVRGAGGNEQDHFTTDEWFC